MMRAALPVVYKAAGKGPFPFTYSFIQQIFCMKQMFIAAAAATLLASCTHIYYAPNTANMPLLSEKGETRVNGVYCKGLDTEFTGGELQLAHAFGPNWGIMVNGMSISKQENTGDYMESGKGSYAEIAAGIFKPLSADKKWIVELYGGGGKGSVKNDYGLGSHSTVGISKLFVQPAMGFKTKYFEAAFAPKLSYVSWNVKDKTMMHDDPNSERGMDAADLVTIENGPNFMAFEPAIIVRTGGKGFKVQGALSFSSNSKNNENTFLAESVNASLGISVNFATAKKQ